MKGHGSLGRRLIGILSICILSAWTATAFFTYLDTVGEIGALLPDGDTSLSSQRAALAESVAAHLMHPLLVAIPLVGLLIWAAVHWGLAPLRTLAAQVRAQAPQNFSPIVETGPDEVRPLVTAINHLLGQVQDLLDRERRFTADAAHELRTPLAAIRTHAQVAAAARTPAEREVALDNVLRGTDRATHLINQLLMLARLDASMSFERADLSALAVQAIEEQVNPAGTAGTELALDAPPGLTIHGNRDLLAVMLRNLLDNAIRYGRSGGHVWLSVETSEGGARLTVADDGPGIAPANRDQVLLRFHRGLGTDRDGCGLGLSIARRIAELHGGTLDLADGPEGRGLTVTVGLGGTP